jgi:hypothetical protein
MESPGQFYALYAEHRNRIRLGLMIAMFAAALLVPWSAAIFVQLRRGEGRFSPLPHVQMISGALLSLEFIYLIMFWQVAGFRDDIDPVLVRLLTDMGWVPFVGLTASAVIQALAMGISMLGDRRERPVFPRWAGYFNVWTALMFTPGSLCVFFKTGPFAYNGILAWYIPVTVFVIWAPLNTYLCLQAIKSQEEEYAAVQGFTSSISGPLDVEQLAVEVAHLRQELARVVPAATP